jgi:hypothetical protein
MEDQTVNWSKTVKIREGAKIEADSPFVYLEDGTDGNLFTAKLGRLNEAAIFKTPPYTAAVNVNEYSWVFRCIGNNEENILVKQSLDQKIIVSNTNLHQKQVEGLFSTDGMLLRIPNTSNLVYLYYYRNQFFCADSNLKLLYRGKTIDTVSHASITIAHIESTGVSTFSSPPLVVNKNCSVNEQYLFVNSALSANNESHSVLNDFSIIDVYELKDGRYKFSFYLPNFRDKKASSFKVINNKLITICDHFIMTYNFNFN